MLAFLQVTNSPRFQMADLEINLGFLDSATKPFQVIPADEIVSTVLQKADCTLEIDDIGND